MQGSKEGMCDVLHSIHTELHHQAFSSIQGFDVGPYFGRYCHFSPILSFWVMACSRTQQGEGLLLYPFMVIVKLQIHIQLYGWYKCSTGWSMGTAYHFQLIMWSHYALFVFEGRRVVTCTVEPSRSFDWPSTVYRFLIFQNLRGFYLSPTPLPPLPPTGNCQGSHSEKLILYIFNSILT